MKSELLLPSEEIKAEKPSNLFMGVELVSELELKPRCSDFISHAVHTPPSRIPMRGLENHVTGIKVNVYWEKQERV